mmetsp:Transcript_24683/g.18686  ORF Transcript_24683/g.18686 Transcript_24683/m.18686 type:complete len:80 (-) Transcript_24683:67-306(-)
MLLSLIRISIKLAHCLSILVIELVERIGIEAWQNNNVGALPEVRKGTSQSRSKFIFLILDILSNLISSSSPASPGEILP